MTVALKYKQLNIFSFALEKYVGKKCCVCLKKFTNIDSVIKRSPLSVEGEFMHLDIACRKCVLKTLMDWEK